LEYLVHIWKEYISETELNRYSTKKMKHDREIRIFKNASAFLPPIEAGDTLNELFTVFSGSGARKAAQTIQE
jgi:hypothetical protein